MSHPQPSSPTPAVPTDTLSRRNGDDLSQHLRDAGSDGSLGAGLLVQVRHQQLDDGVRVLRLRGTVIGLVAAGWRRMSAAPEGSGDGASVVMQDCCVSSFQTYFYF